MFKCDQCDKEFENYRALNGHKRTHSERYHPELRRKPPSRFCLHCGDPCGKNANKYCSNQCQWNHHWVTVGRQQVEDGRGQWQQIHRYLTERDSYCCSECGLQDWRGKQLSLQIDHIDGNSDNNLPANLRFLCPNCHWQMETTLDRTRKSTRRNDYLREVKKERRKMRQLLETLGIEFNFDPEPAPS